MPNGFLACGTELPRLESISVSVASRLGTQATSSLSAKVFRLRVNYGPGYRVYFVQKGNMYVVLLAGGDKATQDRDIHEAKALARDL